MTRQAERHAINCPYCLAGHAEIVVERVAQELRVEAFDQPRRCGLCGRYFRLRYRVQIIGVKLGTEPVNGRVAT